MHPLNGWQEEVGQRTHTHTRPHTRWCPLLSNEGLWSERQRWLKSAWDIWWCWYGSLRLCMWLIMCLCLWVCVCVCYSTSLLECFPICFLCVFDRDERALCSHVCWQEVRHSCTRPQLVSVRILCSFASAHFCSVFFSLLLLRSKSGNRDCLFWFFCTPYLFIYIIPLPLLMPCLIHDWFYDRGEIVRAAPSLPPVWSSLLCQSCTRLPRGGRRALFAFDLATN